LDDFMDILFVALGDTLKPQFSFTFVVRQIPRWPSVASRFILAA